MISNKAFKKIQSSALNYKHLLQYIIKKGKKYTLEKIFRKGLIFWLKNIPNKNFCFIFENAFINTTPSINVKTKRKGSKNIYIPFPISVKRGKFLAAKWLIAGAFLKKKRFLYEGILEELLESSSKQSSSIKKCEELYSLAEESLTNINIKKNFSKVKN